MLIVIITWIYYFIINFLIGCGTLHFLRKITKCHIQITIMRSIITGMMVLTVYAQLFSLFYKVGLVAQLFLLIGCVLVVYRYRVEMYQDIVKLLKTIFSWDGFVYLCVILFCAFFTSRGTFHTDTGIYHAQAIQWIEEYGIVPGLGNLQLHFSYNSAYFAYAALFSMKFMTGISLHTTTGFIESLLCIYALSHLKKFWQHKRHMTDMACMAILFYAVVNLCGSMSPASDYAANFMCIYVLVRWVETIEKGDNDISEYALISVAAVFLLTLKLSMTFMVLLAIYPAIHLIRENRIKEIAIYIFLGILIVSPFIIRNVLISGWLVYPFSSIDLFHVDWKIPISYLKKDEEQIRVWAKCLYDVKLSVLPVQKWVPVWFEEQERYAKMLLGANILSLFLMIVNFVKARVDKAKVEWELVLYYFVVILSILFWFFNAPFIRYGLAFLLIYPLVTMGNMIFNSKGGFYKIISGVCTIGIILCFSPYIDHYVTDDGVFVKQNIKEPFYIHQKLYNIPDLATETIGGIIFSYPESEEQIGYAPLPATSYIFMLERSELRGNSIEDGFRPKK